MEFRDGVLETGFGFREVDNKTLCAPVGIRKVLHGRFELIVGHFLVNLLGIATEPKLACIHRCVFLELYFRLPEGLEVIPSFCIIRSFVPLLILVSKHSVLANNRDSDAEHLRVSDGLASKHGIYVSVFNMQLQFLIAILEVP